MTIGDNKDYIRVRLYSYYTTITGWGVFLRNSTNNHSRSNTKIHTNNTKVLAIVLILVLLALNSNNQSTQTCNSSSVAAVIVESALNPLILGEN